MVTFYIESLVEGNGYEQVSPDFRKEERALAWLRKNAKEIMSDASVKALYLCAYDTRYEESDSLYLVKRRESDGRLVLKRWHE